MQLWKRLLNTFASFMVMLCIGSIYAWSIVASELIDEFRFTLSQSQLIFGTLIAVFPVTMIVIGRLFDRMRFRNLGFISGVLFFLGFYLAARSQGHFWLILLGIGVLVGIATGFGYWLSVTLSAVSFPSRKGLSLGIVTAGFGLGAIVFSKLVEIMLSKDIDILVIFEQIGLSYGLIIAIFSGLIDYHPKSSQVARSKTPLRALLKTKMFFKLTSGIFMGTFAGLFVVGSLKIIGSHVGIDERYLYHTISIFAITNFLGRLFWGALSDNIGASLSIFLALLTQAIAILVLLLIDHSDLSFLLNAGLVGVAFGGNFVLFAKETSQDFGVDNFGYVYPIIFLGYAAAGIISPYIGGVLYDLTGTFLYSISIAVILSLSGSLMFLRSFLDEQNRLRSR